MSNIYIPDRIEFFLNSLGNFIRIRGNDGDIVASGSIEVRDHDRCEYRIFTGNADECSDFLFSGAFVAESIDYNALREMIAAQIESEELVYLLTGEYPADQIIID